MREARRRRRRAAWSSCSASTSKPVVAQQRGSSRRGGGGTRPTGRRRRSTRPGGARTAGARGARSRSRPRARSRATSNGELVRKTSRPPGRSSRAASAIQRSGSHHRLAPYSDSAKSKLASGSGTVLGVGLDQRELDAVLRLHRARRRELALGLVDADGPRAAAGEPGREVGGAAAELDRVQAVDVGERADLGLGDPPHAPARVRARPVALGGLDPLVGRARPRARG